MNEFPKFQFTLIREILATLILVSFCHFC